MTSPTAEHMSGNDLLSRLTEEDRGRLAGHMLVVELEAGTLLQESGHEVVDTWFPCAAAMAGFCVSTHEGNGAIEVALIGREGAIGGIVSNGRVPSYATARVVHGGTFLRIKIAALEQAKLASITLRHWFSRYSDCLLAQVFQTAACNASHTVTQRTAKWLLAAAARTRKSDFLVTQQQLAEMLGVGRTFVARTVRRLREENVLETRRGYFVIKDEAKLRTLSCQCTASIENHFDAVLHGIYPLR
ncbi:MAG TPA: Crp/Fnr family transcriptional regulator [Steroidobacteraceae bacterium]|nr:Crp/Fnr family transcriptional regulator [Steroidobacteraceae bacterium]